jgi:hypothetical protein
MSQEINPQKIRTTLLYCPQYADTISMSRRGMASLNEVRAARLLPGRPSENQAFKEPDPMSILPRPSAEPSTFRPLRAVEPITRRDLQRAAMWGLKLPAAPLAVEPAIATALLSRERRQDAAAVEPPDFVAEPLGPLGWIEPAAEPPADPLIISDELPPVPANPRDSWPAWTDERWTITDARSDIDLTRFANPDGHAFEEDMRAHRDEVHHAELVEAGGVDFARFAPLA